jgi:BNR repeat-like domain
MAFEILDRGFVSRRATGAPNAVSAGPRCAVTPEGGLVCTFMLQSKLGINDFIPVASRSDDLGRTWSPDEPIWPQLAGRFSLFCSVSRSPDGELFLYGTRTAIEAPGESFWSEATQGLKPNGLFWARSGDAGRAWSEPEPIPMPIPGAAEAPGPLCVTRAGRWVACYAPYNTFDPGLRVDRSQVVSLLSDDRGKRWGHRSMLRFPEPQSGAAEAWIIELADGRLLGTSWHMNHADGSDYPNAYALSDDGGRSWSPTRSTGIRGQSTALAPLPDGSALFVYNQRKQDPIGVWIAVVRPTADDFGVKANEIVWRAATATQEQGSPEHRSWTDFAFGEPAVTLLPDGTLLLVLWCIQPDARGIAYVRLRCRD